jgi:hypothetical protein
MYAGLYRSGTPDLTITQASNNLQVVCLVAWKNQVEFGLNLSELCTQSRIIPLFCRSAISARRTVGRRPCEASAGFYKSGTTVGSGRVRKWEGARFARRVPDLATRKLGPVGKSPGRCITTRPQEKEMVHNYHLLGIVHDLCGIVAYAMAILYYALKLYILKRSKESRQE